MSECDHVTDVTAPLPVALKHIAFRVERLAPHHRNPERFHEDKADIVAELERLARQVRHAG
jgi:hypothetical protein